MQSIVLGAGRACKAESGNRALVCGAQNSPLINAAVSFLTDLSQPKPRIHGLEQELFEIGSVLGSGEDETKCGRGTIKNLRKHRRMTGKRLANQKSEK